ncbi:MAG: glutamyl-tRNA reductase [Candidatus Kapaibacteriales bacterium]
MANRNTITLIGLNFRTAKLEEMEDFQISRKLLSKVLPEFMTKPCVDGIVILSTCNRCEFYLSTTDINKPEEIIFEFYEKNLQRKVRKNIFYVKTNSEAVRHLYRVVSGLDSLILGEYQILGQTKEAYSIACQVKTVDRILHRLFHSAFRCGKQVRNQTSISQGRQSISGFATEIVLNSFPSNSAVMLIGVNENIKIIASELKKKDITKFIFVNRTLHKAQQLAEEFGGSAVPLSQISDHLTEAEVIFSSTSAPNSIVSSKLITDSYHLSGNPKMIIDLAIPRDIEVEGIPNTIEYYNIQTLKELIEKEQERKLADLPICEKIIEDEVLLFTSWAEADNSKVFEPYQEKFEKIRLELIEENRNIFSEETFEKIDKITRQLIHRTQAIFVSILKKENNN